MAWILINGDTNGLLVLHTCDNKLCCEPSHLYLGTHKDNSKDAKLRRRLLYGERNVNCKLTDQQVADIRSRYQFRVTTYAMLAEEYMVHESTIERIIHRKMRK